MNRMPRPHTTMAVLAAVFAAAVAGCLQPSPEDDPTAAEESEVPVEGSDADSEEPGGETVDVSANDPPQSCDEGYLVEAVTSLWQTLLERGEARRRLRNRCGSGESIRFDSCSCDALREYLTTADEIEQWRGECCAQSDDCPQRGRCVAGDVDDNRLIDELKRGAEVAVATLQTGLPCPDAGCAGTEHSCMTSTACTEEGRCGVDDEGRCAPTEGEHCLESEACTEDARCTLAESGDGCVLASDDDCAQSADCRERGWCSYSEDDHHCEAGSDEDCQQSRICEDSQRCRRRGGDSPAGAPSRAHCHAPVGAAVDEARNGVSRARRTANAHPFREALASNAEYSASRVREFETYYETQVLDSWMETTLRFPDRQRDDIELAVDCRAYHEVLHEHESPDVFRQGERRVYFDERRIRSDDHVLYDEVSTYCGDSGGTDVDLVSWVGPVWTVHHTEITSTIRGSYVSNNLNSRNLDTGEAAALDRLVETDSVMDAIREDGWVAERLETVRDIGYERDEVDEEDRRAAREALEDFETAQTLQELEEALAGVLREARTRRSRTWDYDSLIGGYAFTDYDPDNNRVAMRLELRDLERRPPRTVLTLGLWVEPREEYRDDFRRAAREGWLKSEAEQRDISMSVR